MYVERVELESEKAYRPTRPCHGIQRTASLPWKWFIGRCTAGALECPLWSVEGSDTGPATAVKFSRSESCARERAQNEGNAIRCPHATS